VAPLPYTNHETFDDPRHCVCGYPQISTISTNPSGPLPLHKSRDFFDDPRHLHNLYKVFTRHLGSKMRITQPVKFNIINKILNLNTLKVDDNPETQIIDTSDYYIRSIHEVYNMRWVRVEIKSMDLAFYFNIDTRQQNFWTSHPSGKKKRINKYYVWLD